MKRLYVMLIAWLMMFWAMPAQAFDHTHKLWNADLKSYVEDGYVHYGVWKRHRADLDRYIGTLQAVNLHEAAKWTALKRYAFWINTYNALVVATVLDHYPFKLGSKRISIRGMYGNKHWQIAGQQVTLNNIRDHILRQAESRHFFVSQLAGRDTSMGEGADLRVLLSMSNGSISTAPLRSEAYVAKRLNQQLDEQVDRVIHDQHYIEVIVPQKTIVAGNIFKMFKQDFRAYSAYPGLFQKSSGSDRGLLRFLFHHMPRTIQDGMLAKQKSPWRFNFKSGNTTLNGGE